MLQKQGNKKKRVTKAKQEHSRTVSASRSRHLDTCRCTVRNAAATGRAFQPGHFSFELVSATLDGYPDSPRSCAGGGGARQHCCVTRVLKKPG